MSKTKLSQQGYTLIEIIVVVGIIAIIFGIGIAAYNRFGNKQSLIRGAQNLTTELRNLQKRADSGELVGNCKEVDSYRATVNVSGTMDYSLVCLDPNETISAGSWTLNADGRSKLSFVSGVTIDFLPLSRGISGGATTIDLVHQSAETAQITITQAGAISCKVGDRPC